MKLERRQQVNRVLVAWKGAQQTQELWICLGSYTDRGLIVWQQEDESYAITLATPTID